MGEGTCRKRGQRSFPCDWKEILGCPAWDIRHMRANLTATQERSLKLKEEIFHVFGRRFLGAPVGDTKDMHADLQPP